MAGWRIVPARPYPTITAYYRRIVATTGASTSNGEAHMKKVLATAAAAVTALGVMAAPAEAASAVQIYRVYFDSPGKDTRSNTSLNAEWVQLFNTSKTSRQLKGMKLRDRTGYTYTFGSFT